MDGVRKCLSGRDFCMREQRVIVAWHNTRRDCVEELLANGGDSLAYNRDYNLACDLTDNRAPVWTLLVHDMQWRTCLQVQLHAAFAKLPPCHSFGLEVAYWQLSRS